MQVGVAGAASSLASYKVRSFTPRHRVETVHAVDELKDVAKSLRRLPVVEPELPTVSDDRGVEASGQDSTSNTQHPDVNPGLPHIAQVALVGAPNVGKSSLVQLLSSGLPEVQNYPFTTRSIKMGHFYVESRRHQVTGESWRVRLDGAARRPTSKPWLCRLPTRLQTRLGC